MVFTYRTINIAFTALGTVGFNLIVPHQVKRLEVTCGLQFTETSLQTAQMYFFACPTITPSGGSPLLCTAGQITVDTNNVLIYNKPMDTPITYVFGSKRELAGSHLLELSCTNSAAVPQGNIVLLLKMNSE
jgi:hypothetical protein